RLVCRATWPFTIVLMLAPKSNWAPPAVRKPPRMSANSSSLSAVLGPGNSPDSAAAAAIGAIAAARNKLNKIFLAITALSILEWARQVLDRPYLIDDTQVAQERRQRLEGGGRGQRMAIGPSFPVFRAIENSRARARRQIVQQKSD